MPVWLLRLWPLPLKTDATELSLADSDWASALASAWPRRRPWTREEEAFETTARAAERDGRQGQYCRETLSTVTIEHKLS